MSLGHFDLCPEDDPEHAKYHRRAKIVLGISRALAFQSVVLGIITIVTVPYALVVGDWVLLRQSAAFAFLTVVSVAGVRSGIQVGELLLKHETARLVRENLSVASAAERLLRSEDPDTTGGHP